MRGPHMKEIAKKTINIQMDIEVYFMNGYKVYICMYLCRMLFYYRPIDPIRFVQFFAVSTFSFLCLNDIY